MFFSFIALVFHFLCIPPSAAKFTDKVGLSFIGNALGGVPMIYIRQVMRQSDVALRKRFWVLVIIV